MDRLTYLKGERRTSRKELKMYIVKFRDEISQECGTVFPSKEKIMQFTSKEFDNWFAPISPKLMTDEITDLFLKDLIDYYLCAVNNVASAELTNTNDMYY